MELAKNQLKLLSYLENMNDFLPSIKYDDGISRFQKWYQTDKKYFCPLWKERYEHWKSFEIDTTLSTLINNIEEFIKLEEINIQDIIIPQINSCLINKYSKGENFIAPHRDSALSFGENPTIIGLSVGETRTIDFIRNDKVNKPEFSFNLESGSIFIMSGSSQRFYQHSIRKSFSENVRYSLTFREFIL